MVQRKEGSLCETEYEIISNTVHEALRAYGTAIGQKPLPHWNIAPKWMKAATLRSVKFVLDEPYQQPGTQHQKWVETKLADGWRFGPTKDGRKKTHPMLVPFEELPREEQCKDAILIALVRAFLQP